MSHLRDIVIRQAAAEDDGLGCFGIVLAADVGFVSGFVGAGWWGFAFEEVGKLDNAARGGLDEVDYWGWGLVGEVWDGRRAEYVPS